MKKQVTPISHAQLEVLTTELLVIKDDLKPLKAAEAVTTRDIKKILGDELHLGVGEYSIGVSQLSCSSLRKTDIKTFVEELRRMGVDDSLIDQALQRSRNVSTRLVVSKADLTASQLDPAAYGIPQSVTG